ncbi:hypothetical protein [Ornithinibacillus bavariensis]|uniref:hypothetical protein n=1 Tax=Ornithinibacillus bavariensis TaxID=545502 RepID=UPI000EF00964|nr:hypothetical protein [Ornithinibacillus sp.]
MQEIELLRLEEYFYRMEAYNLSRVDKERDMHLQAWLNNQVTFTKEQGKKQVPVFKRFEDFFDYEKRLNEVEGKKQGAITPQMRRMARLAAQINNGGG